MVCAKVNGDSPICHEDMGVPLMCLSGSTWQLQGVLSKRGGCRGDGPRPAVLTSIPKLRDWILDTIGDEHDDNDEIELGYDVDIPT